MAKYSTKPAIILSSTRENFVKAQAIRKAGKYIYFSNEVALAICTNIASGMSMRRVSEMEDMPSMQAIWTWLAEKPDFKAMYEEACLERSEAMGEDIIAIADDGTNDWMEDQYQKGNTPGYRVNGEAVQRSKLRVDARMWLMSKMKPRKYGNNIDITSDGKALPAPMYGGQSVKVIDVTEAELVEPSNDAGE